MHPTLELLPRFVYLPDVVCPRLHLDIGVYTPAFSIFCVLNSGHASWPVLTIACAVCIVCASICALDFPA